MSSSVNKDFIIIIIIIIQIIIIMSVLCNWKFSLTSGFSATFEVQCNGIYESSFILRNVTKKLWVMIKNH